jgi:DNA-binding transcriptional LysR family regulator
VRYECLRHAFLQERVLNAQADFGVTLFPVEHPCVESIPLCETTLVCVLPVGHVLTSHKAINFTQLRDHNVITYERGSPFAILSEQVFASVGIPHTAIEVGNPEEACALTQSGVGVALVDRFTASSADAGTVRTLLDAPTLTVRILHRRYTPLSAAARTFVDVLRSALREYDFGQLSAHRKRAVHAV